VAHAKKGSMKKVVKSKVVAQKWLWWSDNGKILIATIQVNLCCLLQLGIGIKIHLNCCNLKNFCHYQTTFWAATFDFTTFFMLPFLYRPHLFLQFGCFCIDFTSFCNLTCIFAFTGYS